MGMDQRELIEQPPRTVEEDFLEPPSGCKMLAEMLAKKKLDIKIATTKSGGLYEKVGVIIDSEDDYVAFSGSQNESKHSFSDTYESIDVYTSWDDAKRAKTSSITSKPFGTAKKPSESTTYRTASKNYHQTCPNTSKTNLAQLYRLPLLRQRISV